MYMKGRILAVICSAILLLNSIMFFVSFPNSPTVLAETGGPGQGEGSNENLSGDWTINSGEIIYYGNRTINLTGNLTVYGKLTLQNVTLRFNSSYDGQYGIYVESGGTFILRDNDNNMNTTRDACNITAINPNNVFSFHVKDGTNFTMRNSILSHCGYYSANNKPKWGLYVNTNNTNFCGNRISHGKYYGVIFYRVNNCNIHNNSCSDNIGFLFEHSHNNLIVFNNIENTNSGLIIFYSDRNLINNNTCNNNNQEGIEITVSNYNIVKDNTCSSNGLGIKLWDSHKNVVYHNNCSSNGCGINFYHSSSTIKSNVCNSNQNDGILVKRFDNNTIIQNICNQNGGNGIAINTEFSSTNNMTISNNICLSNTGNGLYIYAYLFSSDNNQIHDNNFSTNGNAGILTYASKASISYNNIFNNTCINNRYGIHIYTYRFSSPSIYNRIHDNLCTMNGYGILLEGYNHGYVKYNSVNNNTCHNNSIYGIRLCKSSFNNLNNNSCKYSREYGIWLDVSGGVNVKNNTCSNSHHGLYIDSSNRNNIYNNTFKLNSGGECSSGIYLTGSDENNVKGNMLHKNDFGISLLQSERNNLKNNTLMEGGLYIFGDVDGWTTHLIDATNLINGKPICYLSRRIGGGIQNNVGQIILANCSNVQINGHNISNTSNSILMGFSNYNNITNNSFINNTNGGIIFYKSEHNFLSNNNISGNRQHGVLLCEYSHNNELSNNTLINNENGIVVTSSDYNHISYNKICLNNELGIYLHPYSDFNKIHHNSIINNTGRAQVVDNGTGNRWSIGERGNFWSDYRARYPNARNDRWVWDVSYEITSRENCEDYYPLCAPPHEKVPPIFNFDNTSTIPTTGNDFTFFCDFSDNYIVTSVNVIYSYDQINYCNLSMVDMTIEQWNKTITISNNATKLYYFYYAIDASGNYVVTPIKSLNIIDDEPPNFIIENFSDAATTGENIIITAKITDNIRVNEVFFNYAYDGISFNNTQMLYMGDDIWNCTLTISESVKFINYSFFIKDGNENTVLTPIKKLDVFDNDPPVMISNKINHNPTTGDLFTSAVEYFDNIGILKGSLNYTFDGTHFFQRNLFSNDGSRWSSSFDIPHNSTQLKYHYYFRDYSGNINISSFVILDVLDNDVPSPSILMDITYNVGDTVIFNASDSRDNIGITNYTWILHYDNKNIVLYKSVQMFIFEISGVYEINLSIRDEAGNVASIGINITILGREEENDDVDDDISDDDIGDDDNDDNLDGDNDDVIDPSDDDTSDNTEPIDVDNGPEENKVTDKGSKGTIAIILIVIVIVILIALFLFYFRGQSKKEVKKNEIQESQVSYPSIHSTGPASQPECAMQEIPDHTQNQAKEPEQYPPNAESATIIHQNIQLPPPVMNVSIVQTKPVITQTFKGENIPQKDIDTTGEGKSSVPMLPPPDLPDDKIPASPLVEKMADILPPPPI